MTSPRKLENLARSYGLTRAAYRRIVREVRSDIIHRLTMSSKFEIEQDVHAACLRQSGQLVRDLAASMGVTMVEPPRRPLPRAWNMLTASEPRYPVKDDGRDRRFTPLSILAGEI